MNIFGRAAGLSRPRLSQQILVPVVSLALLLATWPGELSAYQEAQASGQAAQVPRYAQQTPEQLQQLVAPIALYPDSLVAQIRAAATFPEQVVGRPMAASAFRLEGRRSGAGCGPRTLGSQ